MENKRYLLFSMILFSLCMISCSNRIEKDAKKQMEQTMRELAKDPSSLQISDIKTMFANDSLCILHFRVSAKNGFGAIRSSLYEYVYLIINRNTESEMRQEAAIDLSDKDSKSILDKARDNYKDRFLETDSISSLKDEDRKAWHLYLASSIHMILGGRTIGEDQYDIDNW